MWALMFGRFSHLHFPRGRCGCRGETIHFQDSIRSIPLDCPEVPGWSGNLFFTTEAGTGRRKPGESRGEAPPSYRGPGHPGVLTATPPPEAVVTDIRQNLRSGLPGPNNTFQHRSFGSHRLVSSRKPEGPRLQPRNRGGVSHSEALLRIWSNTYWMNVTY